MNITAAIVLRGPSTSDTRIIIEKMNRTISISIIIKANASPLPFCDEAWKAVYQYVFTLAHGVQEIWNYSDWIRTLGVAIVSCNDGLRPVIMKLEATDIDSLPYD